MNKSRKLVFFVGVGCLLAGLFGWAYSGKTRWRAGEKDQNSEVFTGMARQESHSRLPMNAVLKNTKVPLRNDQSSLKEDFDIIDFVRKIDQSTLSEELVLSMLKSSLSPNKKTVLLSLYNKQGGNYYDSDWEPVLLSLILDSDSWPELANKAADGLAQGNHEGQWDSSIIQALEMLGEQGDGGGDGEVVKRTALAFSLRGKDAIETAQSRAMSEPEFMVLTKKHAGMLDQSGRLEAYRSQPESSLKTLYLAAYLKNAPSKKEISRGLSLGMNDPKISSFDQPSLFLAASEASFSGKTAVIFDHWLRLGSQNKNPKSASALGTIVSIAVQKSAFSEASPQPLQGILAFLLSQNTYNPDDSTDLRITLALLMIHGCSDPLVEKVHCPELDEDLKLLRTRLVREGLGKYL